MALNFNGGWSNFQFFKSGSEIKAKAETKVQQLQAKLEDRQNRINAMCKEKGLDITQLLTNIDAFANGMSSDALRINIGELSQIKAETRAMKDERNTLEQLQIIVRNVVPSTSYELTFSQLEYLDF